MTLKIHGSKLGKVSLKSLKYVPGAIGSLQKSGKARCKINQLGAKHLKDYVTALHMELRRNESKSN